MTSETIRILLVDDHPLFREGIKASLGANPDMMIVGEAGDGLEAVEKAGLLKPDVVLLDIAMPKMNGLEAGKVIREKHPQSEVLILSMHNEPEYLQHFLKIGVKGYVLKDAPPAELSAAIRKLAAGFSYTGTGLLRETSAESGVENYAALAELSIREVEILKLITASSRSKDIAAQLGISVRTVEKHRCNIMKKLGIDHVAGLTRYALHLESLQRMGINP